MMLYNVYKYISDQDFILVQPRLLALRSKILEDFSRVLSHQKRAGEDDYLILNFIIADDFFDGRLAILFEDKPAVIEFQIGITKSFDEGKIRYYKREDIIEHVNLENLEKDVEFYCKKAIEIYNLWSEQDVRASDSLIKS